MSDDRCGVDDLERVLGYRDAVDPRTGVSVVAPDVLLVPFWTSAFCRAVVRAAEAVGGFSPHPDDPVPGHEVSLAAISPARSTRCSSISAAGSGRSSATCGR